MSESDSTNRAGAQGEAAEPDATRNNQENELEAEQESAEAMDAEVPQPPGTDQTTEGQPS